jgi:hypothetical protein
LIARKRVGIDQQKYPVVSLRGDRITEFVAPNPRPPSPPLPKQRKKGFLMRGTGFLPSPCRL